MEKTSTAALLGPLASARKGKVSLVPGQPVHGRCAVRRGFSALGAAEPPLRWDTNNPDAPCPSPPASLASSIATVAAAAPPRPPLEAAAAHYSSPASASSASSSE